MRVGVIHGVISTLGGAERVAVSLVDAFVKQGYYVDLFVSASTSFEIIRDIFGIFSDEKVYVHRLPELHPPVFGIYANLLNRVMATRAGSGDDLIVETSGVMVPLWMPKKPYFVYCNGIVNLALLDVVYKGWRGLYSFPYSKLCEVVKIGVRRVTIISNSEHTQRLVKVALHVDSQVVYPPVATRKWLCEGDVHDRSGVLSINRFSPERNLELQVGIMRRLPDVKLTMIGRVTKNNVEYYNFLNTLSQCDALKNIRILANLGDRDIIAQAQRSKVFLNTCFDESFGIAVVEAIAAGCVPVVPDHAANRETVPYSELRFQTLEEAVCKIRNAIEGRYDHLLPKLQAHTWIFDEKVFQERVFQIIKV